jgi:hypothetical protein
MTLIILASILVAAFGAITVAWVLSQGDTRPKTPPPASLVKRPAETEASERVPRAASPPVEDRPSAEPINTLPVSSAVDELALRVNPLRLNIPDVLALQIERLQLEYTRLDGERERLAQELLASWLIEKIERSAGRLEADTEQASLDLRQQLAKVSTDHERIQFRLAAFQHLQTRLDDPRVAHHLDDLVMAVKQVAGER